MSGGPRGPVPKPASQRRRRNKDPETMPQAVTVPAGRRAEIPPADEDWHPLAAAWYESLQASGQAALFQESDWAQARVWAEILSRELHKGLRMSAQMITAWSSGAAELLTTEGARRRMRVELQRIGEEDPDEEAAVTEIDEYRKRLEGGR